MIPDFDEFELGERCFVQSSKRIFAKEYVAEGIPFFRSKDVIDKSLGEFTHYDLFISKERYFEIKEKHGAPIKGDLLISSVGNRSGLPYIVNDEGDFYFKDGNILWLSRFNHIDPNFLAYWLKSDDGKSSLDAIMIGSAQKALTIDGLKKLRVRFPDLEIQKSASAILRSLDDKIELNRRMNATLEAMAQALFKSWFVDFDPVIDNCLAAGHPIPAPLQERAEARATLADQRQSLPETIRQQFPNRFVCNEDMGWVPEGWEVVKLGKYVTVKRGGSPRPIHDFLVDEGLPWVKISDATASISRFLMGTKQFIKPEGLSKTIMLNKGDLILSNSATPGIPKFLELDACVHDGWLYFPQKKQFGDQYLFHLFLSIREELLSQGNGSIFTNLKTDILKDHILLKPNKILLDHAENRLGEIHHRILLIQKQTETLTQLRDTLLPKLLSGQLRIPEAEQQGADML